MDKEIRRPNYINYNGLIMSAPFPLDALRSAIDYKHKPGQLFVVTYPKCGTTWTQQIAMMILRKGRPFENVIDFFLSTPYFEFAGTDAIDMMKGPGVIKTHLPLRLIKFSPEAKYVYVARNPKDCCVSFYHHTKDAPFYKYSDATFDDFFELFIRGEVEYGDYFDHLIPWYQHRNDPNVCFITYEDLKKDAKGEILKLGKFFGEGYYKELQDDSKYLENVLHYSSFNYMKNQFNADLSDMFMKLETLPNKDVPMLSGMKHLQEYMEKNTMNFSQTCLVRKGEVGDWKNYFTPEQEKKMAEYIAKKTAGSDVMSLWNTSE